MAVSRTLVRGPRWYLVPARILLLTLLFTMLCFALSLLIGILALVLRAYWQGVHPNMTAAYRHIAVPTAVVASVVALILAAVMEIRHYRQTKALAEIERAF
jgi:hypothetical protein